MAESQRSRAVVWLAASSTLLVLLASGVAVSRIGKRSGELQFHFSADGFGPNCDPSRLPRFDIHHPNLMK